MKILMKILSEERPMIDDPAELALTLFRMARDAYGECAGDGKADPEGIAELARSWNPGLADDFQRAISEAEQASAGVGAGRWLSVPGQLVYGLKKAAMALDGDFYCFAEKALLVNEYRYFTTRLSDVELEDVARNPGSYAAIDVYPK